ncbi:MAG: diaminopimelate epimerase [Dehalococcoidia bacterium]|nr:diaminopimelate epimerase [Dehalococcoidia bacterium]
MDFAKLQATGNDFILIDASNLERNWERLARSMCQRRFAVGGDGLILLLKSRLADFRIRIFNSDGSEAEICGNGLRCLARYVIDRGLAEADKELTVETPAGVKRIKSHSDGRFQVDMGMPMFRPEEIPVAVTVDIIPVVDYPVNAGGRELLLTFVSMGNPHGVCFVQELADFPLSELGPIMQHHDLFPQRLNFEIARVVSRSEIIARVWERGAGETLSCGSGACAVAVAAQLHGYVDSEVDVILPGGRLGVVWDGKGEVYLSGGAELVFTGEWPDRDLLLEE